MPNHLKTEMESLKINDQKESGMNSSGSNSPSSANEAEDFQSTMSDLISRCKTLHEEVEIYVAEVEAKKLTKTQSPVEYRSIRNDFKNELLFLQKLADDSKINGEKAKHYVVSSNIVYYEGLWNAAKRSEGLLSFRKYFFWNRQEEGHRAAYQGLSLGKGSQVKGKSAALVDIVAKDGLEWIRVSTASEKRLLFDLAKLGWQNDSDEEDGEEMDVREDPMNEEDDEDEVEVVKHARQLARAAKANPIRGHSPKVRFVLTRVHSGKVKEIDMILNKIRATGAIVQCANELSPAPSLSEILLNLLVDRSRTLSDTLNIDCTILLALISDISHSNCPILDWYPGEVRAQITEEEKEKLLPTHLYPTIGSHHMVCTQEAADQMNLIVDTLATDTEKTRADLLLGQREHASTPQAELRKLWQDLSNHTMPENFQLPIKVMPSNVEESFKKLPKVAEAVARELSPLNTAIFFYGWANKLTTLSSNRTRARQIEHVINQGGLKDGEAGPHVWLCGESRSLIAKHGRRK